MYDSLILIVLVLVGVVFILPIVAMVSASRAAEQARRLKGETERLHNLVRRLDARIRQLESGSPAGQEKPADAAPAPPLHHEDVEIQLRRKLEKSVSPVPVANVPVETIAARTPDQEAVPEADPAKAAQAVPEPKATPAKLPGRLADVDWEQFMGAKLFAWIATRKRWGFTITLGFRIGGQRSKNQCRAVLQRFCAALLGVDLVLACLRTCGAQLAGLDQAAPAHLPVAVRRPRAEARGGVRRSRSGPC